MGQAFCPEVSNTNEDLRGLPQRGLKRGGLSSPHRGDDKRPKRPLNAAKKEDFSPIKVIGVGSYGKVFLVKHRHNGRIFAMKVIKKELVFRTMQDEGIKGK